MAVQTVRHKILEYLGRHADASTSQIGHAVGVAAPSVRYHLGVLRSDGRVSVAGQRGAGTRGRPTKIYRLSERLRGNNLPWLADVALGELLKGPPRRVAGAVETLAKALAAQIGVIDLAASGSRRLAALIESLNILRYEASWEAGAAGPHVLFGHCPYADIIAKHPELCGMDTRMLGAVLGVAATQTAKIDPRLGGQARCIFVLK
jgi:DeoR family suf operon transcriptional repressor